MILLKRLRTAILLLVPLFLIIQYGSPLLLFIVLQAFILAALFEFFALARKKKLHAPGLSRIVIALHQLFLFLPGRFSPRRSPFRRHFS